MQAMVLERPGLPLRAVQVPKRAPGFGQVLVKVAACGVCRTDLHVVDGELTEAKLPIIPGHEIVGRVESVGPSVGQFRAGDRVGIPWLGHTCGTCAYCTARPREPLRRAAVHGLSDRRGLCRIRDRRCQLLLRPAGELLGCRGGAAAVRRAHRLSLPAHGRRGGASGHLRLRRRRPHRGAGGPASGSIGLRLHPAGRRRGAGVRAWIGLRVGRRIGRGAAGPARCRRHLRRPSARWCRRRSPPCARGAWWSSAAST